MLVSTIKFTSLYNPSKFLEFQLRFEKQRDNPLKYSYEHLNKFLSNFHTYLVKGRGKGKNLRLSLLLFFLKVMVTLVVKSPQNDDVIKISAFQLNSWTYQDTAKFEKIFKN